MIKRSQHWLDEPQARGRKRTIRNWMHHRAPQAVGKLVADDFDPWIETRPKAKPPNGVIPKWTGNIDMAFASLDAPLQAFAGDTTDAKNSALWGVRCADRPGSWANWKAYGVVEGVSPRIDEDEAGNVIGATWPGLWPGADLEIRHEGHKVSKRIIIRERSAPTHYEFTLKLAGGHTSVQVGNTLSIRDAQGVERLRTMPPWAHDSATTAPTPDGHQHFGVALNRMSDVRGSARYSLDIDPKDLASAVLPMPVDPSTTISGTTAIEDAAISNAGSQANYNFGSFAYNYAGSYPASYWSLYRIATSSIPAGVITAFRHRIFKAGYTTQSANVRYQALAASNGWIEGTGNGTASQNGSCCYNSARYAELAWSATLLSSSLRTEASYTDIDTYPSEAGAGEQFVDLNAAWLGKWKSGEWENNGFLLKEFVASRATSLGYTHRSTEWTTAGERPYFEATYVLGGAAAMLARRIHE